MIRITFQIVLSFLFALNIALTACTETDEPECDGDGASNGCPEGEYCSLSNVCTWDCSDNSDCDNGEECNDSGECTPVQN